MIYPKNLEQSSRIKVLHDEPRPLRATSPPQLASNTTLASLDSQLALPTACLFPATQLAHCEQCTVSHPLGHFPQLPGKPRFLLSYTHHSTVAVLVHRSFPSHARVLSVRVLSPCIPRNIINPHKGRIQYRLHLRGANIILIAEAGHVAQRVERLPSVHKVLGSTRQRCLSRVR